MKPLEPPYLYHLRAAIGWLELGRHIEANEELEKITERLRAHPDVLKVMIDSTGFHYSSGGYAPDSLTTNDIYRVNLNYTASNSNLVMTIARNNEMFVSNCVASLGTNFTDLRVDTISFYRVRAERL